MNTVSENGPVKNDHQKNTRRGLGPYSNFNSSPYLKKRIFKKGVSENSAVDKSLD